MESIASASCINSGEYISRLKSQHNFTFTFMKHFTNIKHLFFSKQHAIGDMRAKMNTHGILFSILTYIHTLLFVTHLLHIFDVLYIQTNQSLLVLIVVVVVSLLMLFLIWPRRRPEFEAENKRSSQKAIFFSSNKPVF